VFLLSVVSNLGPVSADSSRYQESHLANGNIVQVIGKVNPDLTVKVLSSRDLGSDVGTSLTLQSYIYLPSERKGS
jgi:replication factor A3